MRDEWEQLVAAAAGCAHASVWPLSDGEVVEALQAVQGAAQAVHAALLHLVREVDARNVASAQQASSTVSWLSRRLRVSGGRARRLVEQARTVEARPVLDAALVAGRVGEDQVTVVGSCVHDLVAHADVPATLVDQAERVLVGWAPELDPGQLQRAAGRVLEHVAPEVAERVEREALRRADRRAERDRFLTLSPAGDGRVRLRGVLGVTEAATVSAALEPLCSPRTTRARTRGGGGSPGGGSPGSSSQGGSSPGAGPGGGSQGGECGSRGGGPGGEGGPNGIAGSRGDHGPDVGHGAGGDHGTDVGHETGGGHGTGVGAGSVGEHPADARTPGQRRADALVDVCRLALRAAELPADGGDRPQLAVTVPFDVLAQKLGVGTLDGGERVDGDTVRQLACDARLVPVVLDGDGQVLDVGRARRLATGALRRALVVRDQGCTFPGCDRPPRWCDGHHIVHWADGGSTSLGNLALLCGYHHRLVHREAWQVSLAPDGHPQYRPPPHLGSHPDRQPVRRNHYPLRR
ncbi:HNH endonuclease signature motif containing protein [Mangrovihabitans endophyticus]|uniref:HNH nuclease domain-containing protein n=1 Tax=Mangrovihabitans endophyticus TaxID=1751298 RepID=A0A8J3C316_9ACTN|nr:HNH endonuclease signature motif containing protein [Mangrovihabitans endophyticus]GGL07928.1 hypothetical protein GCM10012284_47970 [Mangrovihabitans endophyticus]